MRLTGLSCLLFVCLASVVRTDHAVFMLVHMRVAAQMQSESSQSLVYPLFQNMFTKLVLVLVLW